MQLDEFIQDVARGAGEIVMAGYGASSVVRSKSGRGDIVTEADERAERYVIDRIRAEFSDARILSEEAGLSGPDDARDMWIIDPLDGTRNFAEGIPFFCVSIGLARDGRVEAGAICDPMHDEMFYARRGQGAFCNDRPIRVTEETSIDDGIISVSWVKRKVDRTKFIEYVDEISRETSYFRRLGSAALMMAYVASGRVHGYLQGGLNPWDLAAGIVLVEEAGGLVTDFAGHQIDLTRHDIEVVTANPVIHAMLLGDVIGRGARSRRGS